MIDPSSSFAMSHTRRSFLHTAAALPVAAAFSRSFTSPVVTHSAGQPKKAVLVSMLPKGTYLERFTIGPPGDGAQSPSGGR